MESFSFFLGMVAVLRLHAQLSIQSRAIEIECAERSSKLPELYKASLMCRLERRRQNRLNQQASSSAVYGIRNHKCVHTEQQHVQFH